MMNQPIQFKTAILAKGKGFPYDKESLVPFNNLGVDYLSVACYDEYGKDIRPKIYNHRNTHYIKASQTWLQSWLRKKAIKVFVEPYCYGYKWRLYHSNMAEGEHGFILYETWEEALEAGLLKGLEFVL